MINIINYNKLTEKKRGNVNSVLSVSFFTLLNIILNTYFQYDIKKDTGFSVFLLSNLLNYVLDLMFAKNIYKRKEYFLNSFVNKIFFKYIILVVIDIIICILITDTLIKYLNDNKILINPKIKKYRDIVIIFIVPSITSILFVNQLRFDWCYNKKSNSFLDIMMYIWLTIVLYVYRS